MKVLDKYMAKDDITDPAGSSLPAEEGILKFKCRSWCSFSQGVVNNPLIDDDTTFMLKIPVRSEVLENWENPSWEWIFEVTANTCSGWKDRGVHLLCHRESQHRPCKKLGYHWDSLSLLHLRCGLISLEDKLCWSKPCNISITRTKAWKKREKGRGPLNADPTH